MTDLNSKAVEILNSIDSKFYVDMTEPIRLGFGDTILAYDDGILINVRGTWMWMAQSEKRAIEFCEYIKKHSDLDCGLVVHDMPVLEVSCDVLGGLGYGVPCYMAARFSDEQFDIKTDAVIKKLTHEYDELVWHTYGFIKDHDWGKYVAKESIDAGMYGAFVDGQCAGFIGTHIEGTMGMLEVLPQFRRRGYGLALEQYLINDYLKSNRIPFCHILETNDASINLQKSMGFWLSEKKLCWLGN